jgi:hypothetical protein
MLDKMGKSIDAVSVSTPDHMHAVAGITAMKMGKHVYIQKPLTQSVYEARLMRKVAKEQKVATQMGNQGSAGTGNHSIRYSWVTPPGSGSNGPRGSKTRFTPTADRRTPVFRQTARQEFT